MMSKETQPLSEYGFAYGLKTETRQFSTNFSCEPHVEGKETCLCPSTDPVRFRLFPSTVWAGLESGKFQGVPEARAHLHANFGEVWRTLANFGEPATVYPRVPP